jgi:hypothetical protein
MQKMHFLDAEHYLRSMHPEYAFVFSLERNALAYWGYSKAQAHAAQSNMIEMACSRAQRQDRENDLEIVFADESPQERYIIEPARDWDWAIRAS